MLGVYIYWIGRTYGGYGGFVIGCHSGVMGVIGGLLFSSWKRDGGIYYIILCRCS
jgi:hypothetical protein